MKYTVEDVVKTGPRKLGKGSALACLERSGYVLASMLAPGDLVSGNRVTEKLLDEDGEVTLVFEDESHHSVG